MVGCPAQACSRGRATDRGEESLGGTTTRDPGQALRNWRHTSRSTRSTQSERETEWLGHRVPAPGRVCGMRSRACGEFGEGRDHPDVPGFEVRGLKSLLVTCELCICSQSFKLKFPPWNMERLLRSTSPGAPPQERLLGAPLVQARGIFTF